MAFRIVFTQNAIDDFKALDVRLRGMVREAIGTHLTHGPAKQSKARIKRLRDLKHPQFRLRVGDARAFYDVAGTDVVIIAIMSKERTIEWLGEHGKR